MNKKPSAYCSAKTYCPTCPAYCCIVAGEIEVSSKEAVTIHASVGGHFEELFRNHPTLGLLIAKPSTGRCIFLDEKNACTIYDIRPKVCRSYYCKDDSTIFSVKTALAEVLEGKMPKKVTGGPVLNSLDDVTALMVKLGSLIEEGGPLSRAPKEIKDITYDTLDSMKKLTYKLTDLVGESARKRDEAAKHVKEATVACVKAQKIIEISAAKYNKKDYVYYVFRPRDGAILSGWEFREDAKDFVADLEESGIRGLKIYTLGKLKQLGIDPNKNKNWKNPY